MIILDIPNVAWRGAFCPHGPAFVVDNVLSPSTCQHMIEDVESLGFGTFDCGRNLHGALQILVDPHTYRQIDPVYALPVDVVGDR